jgi:hypothetical protein
MAIHGPANIEKGHDFDSIPTLRAHFDVEPALFGCAFDRACQVQLIRCTVARKFTQAAQGDLDIARADFLITVEVFKDAFIPNFDSFPVTAFFLTDANAFGIVAISAKWRTKRRGDDG